MSYKRRLIIATIITYLLLIPLAAYFRYFPMIINSEVTNILIFILVFLLTSLLVYGAFIIKKSTDIYFFLPQSLILVFIARAIPNLRLSYPPLHDSYYHYVCTLNIIRYGTLKPVLGWWYSLVNTQLHWPDMHLLTTVLRHITDIDIMQIFRFQEPVVGMIFFLGIFILTKSVTKNDRIAMLSALFASISDIIIFYQSEYHPQGFAIVLLMFLLYAFIKSRPRLVNNIYFRYVALIFYTAFMLSHHFTPLFFALIFSMYLTVLLIVRTLSPYVIRDKVYKIVENIKSDCIFLIIVIVPALAYYFVVYTMPVEDFTRMAISKFASNSHLALIEQLNVPLLTLILRLSKWGLFILAIISILWIIKTKNMNEFRLAVLFICIVFAGAIEYYVIALTLDRIIGFYTPVAAVFGSLTFFRFRDEWFRDIQKNKKVMLAVLISSILITCGFFNSQTPAYFFQASGVNTYYWYSNDLSSMDKYGVTGGWIKNYTPNGSKYITEFDTIILPFYYAERPLGNIENYLYYVSVQERAKDLYLIVNPMIPYSFGGNYFDKRSYLKSVNILYDNGVLIVGKGNE